MLSFLPGPLHAAIIMILLIVNTLFWATQVYVAVLFKLLTPKDSAARNALSRTASWLAQQWAVVNAVIVAVCMRIEWDIRIEGEIRRDGQYLVCSNHQSWNDIFVLMTTFGTRAPFFKFFLKQELIWVPILGLCWWGLDYPFMKRYSAETLQKNPELRGKDLETTRKACAAFRNQPALVLNFLEGTRFTQEKHDRQKSRYTHLLKPKSGGFAFAMSALGERLNSLLDITIVYPEGAQGFWAFASGKVRKVVVEVKQLTIPHEFFVGDYENDTVFRKKFQAWIGALWTAKDQRIAELLAEAKAR